MKWPEWLQSIRNASMLRKRHAGKHWRDVWVIENELNTSRQRTAGSQGGQPQKIDAIDPRAAVLF
jgi:hypothetical protein